MTRWAATAGATVLAVALSACTPAATPAAQHDTPPNEVSGVDIPAGRVDAAVAQLDGLAQDLMTSTGIPGLAVAVVHGGKAVYAKGFGVRDTRNGDGPDNAVNADTVFQLASMSKPVGATVVAQQISAGTIAWDTPVVTQLPWFALSDPYVTDHITIADLYAHRSGLPDHAGDRLEDLGYDRREVLQRLRYLPLAPFRNNYDYTNFGLTAAAEAVAGAAGVPWEQLSADVLYRPLGMASTSSRYADFLARPNRALTHVKTDDSYQPRYQRNPDAQSPAGGVSSSVNDMARWLAMVLDSGSHDGTQIIAPEALLPAITPQVISAPAGVGTARPGFYGEGFNVSITSSGRTQYGHSGAFLLGAATAFSALPSQDVGIVVLTNATPIGAPETLIAQFLDLVQYGEIRENWPTLYRQALAPMSQPEGALVGVQPPAHPAPARPLSQYVGEYANSYWGPATVTEDHGALDVSLGPQHQRFRLSHYDGDTFTFTLQGENAPDGTISKATFTKDAVELEYFDHDKLGRFTR
ncbi:serine hydrolase [Mycolicibacter virginiensis]|uniref:Serine hydrolase n=1 Tax=Mycolicibacter virginiensis TaxID=1795032 RepID=A0A9X7NWI6_9MYCO|nr:MULTISPECIES: serine hydrolase [Mycobacteriaceae]PQM49973.1 serine hydrolase [Mycolicibacter virginiensis]